MMLVSRVLLGTFLYLACCSLFYLTNPFFSLQMSHSTYSTTTFFWTTLRYHICSQVNCGSCRGVHKENLNMIFWALSRTNAHCSLDLYCSSIFLNFMRKNECDNMSLLTQIIDSKYFKGDGQNHPTTICNRGMCILSDFLFWQTDAPLAFFRGFCDARAGAGGPTGTVGSMAWAQWAEACNQMPGSCRCSPVWAWQLCVITKSHHLNQFSLLRTTLFWSFLRFFSWCPDKKLFIPKTSIINNIIVSVIANFRVLYEVESGLQIPEV